MSLDIWSWPDKPYSGQEIERHGQAPKGNDKDQTVP